MLQHVTHIWLPNRMRFLQLKLQPRALSPPPSPSLHSDAMHRAFSSSQFLVAAVAFSLNLLHAFRYQLVYILCTYTWWYIRLYFIVIFCFYFFAFLFYSQFCPVPFCRFYCTLNAYGKKNILSWKFYHMNRSIREMASHIYYNFGVLASATCALASSMHVQYFIYSMNACTINI